jgi:hypothetical protein
MGVSVFAGIVAMERILRERQAKGLVRRYDGGRLDLAEVIDEERRLLGGEAPAEGQPRRRFRTQNLLRLATALADKAYYQFGARDESEANKLITRKYMRECLMEYKDLRAKDAAAAIDLALPLSFLPSRSLQYVNSLRRTWTYAFRSSSREKAFWLWAFWPIQSA